MSVHGVIPAFLQFIGKGALIPHSLPKKCQKEGLALLCNIFTCCPGLTCVLFNSKVWGMCYRDQAGNFQLNSAD